MKAANRATLTGGPVLFLMGLSATAPLTVLRTPPKVWRVSVKQLQSRQQCLPELFLHILKPYDRIKQTDKSVFVGVSDGNY